MPPAFRIHVVGLAVMAALSGWTCEAGAQAPAATRAPVARGGLVAYDLPPAALSTTLRAIAAASGAGVQFDDALVSSRRAREVSGSLTVEEALVQALRGSGLAAVVRGTGFGVVASDEAAGLQRVVVVARRDQAELEFKADRSDTATRSGTSLMEVPQSVTILTNKLLESQQTINVQDALSNVSGVVLLNNVQGTPVYSIRGFSDNGNALVNGLESFYGTSAAVNNVERLEVLKGPQAVLAGNGFPGGAVNIVLKKPQAEPVRNVALQFGSHSDKMASGDLSGVVSDDSRLTYRVTASVARAKTADGGFDGRREDALLPQLRWKDDRLDVVAGLSYLKNHVAIADYTFWAAGTAGKPGGFLQRPGTLLSNAGDGYDLTEKRGFYDAEFKLDSHFTLVSRLQRSKANQEASVYIPQQRGPFNQAVTTLAFVGSHNVTDNTTTSGDHYVRIEADTGPIAHVLSVGLNHSDVRAGTLYGQDLTGAAVNVDVMAPVQAVLPPTSALPQPIFSESNTRQRGVYLQDTLRWGDVTALISGRRTSFNTTGVTTFNGRANPPFGNDYSKTDPSLGLVYSVTPWASVYANAMKGMTANSVTAICGAPKGDPAPPRRYMNTEAGAKLELLDNRLSVTGSVYKLDETNTISFVPASACYNLIAAQRTKGYELDVQGRLLPGWNMVGNYSHSTATDVGTPTNLYYGKPKNKASLWTTYDVTSGPADGVAVGLGVNYTGTSLARDAVGPVDIPTAITINANVGYRLADWQLLLGVKNLTDRQNFGPTLSTQFVPLLSGRTYALTVRKSFN